MNKSTTDFRALCAELVKEWERVEDGDFFALAPIMDCARAALAFTEEETLGSDGGYETGSMWAGHGNRLNPVEEFISQCKPLPDEMAEVLTPSARWRLYEGESLDAPNKYVAIANTWEIGCCYADAFSKSKSEHSPKCNDALHRDAGRSAVYKLGLKHGFKQIKPIASSERTPEENDCDENGRCWVGCPSFVEDGDYGTITYNPSWELCTFVQGDTHWLPHWALHIPTTETKE